MTRRENELLGYALAWDALTPTFGVYRLHDPDRLLDELDGPGAEELEHKGPYHGALWPSGEALARHILDGPAEAFAGKHVVELGCGPGSAGLAAAVQGASVSFLDWAPRALALVERSAERLGVVPRGLHVTDWTSWEPATPPWRILAADVLYERKNVPDLVQALARLLSGEAEAWVVDPGRAGLDDFLEALRGGALRLLEDRALPPTRAGVETRLLRVTRVA